MNEQRIPNFRIVYACLKCKKILDKLPASGKCPYCGSILKERVVIYDKP